ncbi:tyrosine-type recombinase/integrase [Sphingomonas aerophila]|uniref:Integrase n=1 Tax=Sphingomonas aerophila TaxID=1344948 RepID=A0A7W9BCV5_9SPHN|nr:tyrosine-type recombinase/integrase [Sphingomonas aerophila]MBB5714858.1 integrase [Sphingomonas aerophila]
MKRKKKGVAKPRYTYVARGTYWRFRYQRFDAPLPGSPGEPAFEEKYEQLIALVIKPEPPIVMVGEGTFRWVLDRYFRDVVFRSLAEGTQRTYRHMSKTIYRLLGDCDMVATTPAMIAGVRDAVTIGGANNMRAFISRLYSYASSMGWIESHINRARDLKVIKRKVPGHVPWSDDELALLLRHAEGETRTLIILAICTAQRAIDLVTTDWSQVLGENIRVRQKKTNMLIDIPMHPLLQEELRRLRSLRPVSGRIVRHANGDDIGNKGFNERLTKLIAKIPNMPHRTPHGARYAAAAMMEEAGCTVFQIQAILGHSTYQQAMAYIIRRRESRAGMDKLVSHAQAEARRKWQNLGGLRVVS